ncbi:class I SAM-dependent methyltransferase [Oscillochloris sp. ZM17-4]|uniref:class I SAM-dependent DNA methyltransferase n=1 Tax=Oscillochloris sp. ZM17-4 TaxID=2866714 RepID=UPI001C73B7ED|nr:class I SAM-dependent methyltransferase [Oscillochloris sp. ZM17-4]MBX0331222.1 class I SAM-dependent methyltransferase [Oscillochloris sp. ZM17-4]
MENYTPATSFGADTAADYDDLSQRGDEAATVALLEQLAGGGPALELAIGTGRIALPLAARGIRVDGIDFSPEMVARLRAKPGGAQIAVTIGNYADVAVPGSYRLIYIVFNTLFNLLTQDEQVRCFENVAAHLSDDGLFVVEGGVPAEFYNLRNNQYVDAEAITGDSLRLDVARFDPVTQLLEETHVTLSGAGIRLSPIVTRYAWPAELDLMARIAGLRLRERWGGWGREPFTARSGNCVSVYGRL